MTSRVLLEDSFKFVPDHKFIAESIKSGGPKVLPLDIPGDVSECGVINDNNRRYRRPVWEKNLAPGSRLRELMDSNESFGQLEHPKDGQVDLTSPFSHMLVDLRLVEGATPETPKLRGKLRLLNTPEGNRMLAYMEGGYNPRISTRGFGSLERSQDGVDDVQEDYVCEGADFVFKPSFKSAKADGTPAREALAATRDGLSPASPATDMWSGDPQKLLAMMNRAVGEGVLKAGSVRLVDGKVVLESQETTATSTTATAKPVNLSETTLPPPAAETQSKATTMDKFTSIRESLNSLRTADLASITPDRLAGGLTQMESLHEQVAAIGAEDPKASWSVQKAHNEISQVETAWKTAANAPRVEVTKLQESNNKLVRVLHATADTALKIKHGLGEALKTGKKAQTDLAEAIRRGAGWMERAKRAESKLEVSTRRLDLCYESLDEFTKRYNEDMCAMGRRLLEVEFKPTDAAVLKSIKEATHPKQLVRIREQLDPKAPKEGAKPVVSEAKPGDKKPVAEGETKTVTVAPPIGSDAKPAETLVHTFVRPFSISEGAAMAARLSSTGAVPAAK